MSRIPNLITGKVAKLPGDYAPRTARKHEPQPIPPLVAPLLPHGGVAEYQFCEHREWRFDYAWPEHRVALEIEGGVWSGGRHVRGRGYVNDLTKYNTATLEGWALFRATPQQLDSGEAGAWVARYIGELIR